jgi:signal recognition particle GTPase
MVVNKEAVKPMTTVTTVIDALKDIQIHGPALITILLLVLTTLIFFVYRQWFKSKADTVLFVGLTGSGKTTIFTKLINPGILKC